MMIRMTGRKLCLVVKLFVFVFEVDRVVAGRKVEVWIVGVDRVAKIDADLGSG
jgi:hypothetical protein